MMAALVREQWRAPRTGKPSSGKRAGRVRGEMTADIVLGYQRIARDAAWGSNPSAFLKITEQIGAYLDDKPPGPTRVTKTVLSTDKPSQEAPPGPGPAADR